MTYLGSSTTVEDLYQAARDLAMRQAIRYARRLAFPLQRQLRQDVRSLNAAAAAFEAASRAGEQIPPAAEWLVDNAYMVAEQAQFILRHFPAGYYRRLPVIAEGPDRGLPRVHAIVLALLDETGGRCDPEVLVGYLRAYQEVRPLTMGELWAVPLFLRVAIVNKLGQVFAEITRHDAEKQQADAWLRRIDPYLVEGREAARDAVATAEEHVNLHNPAVLVHLARRLREYETTPALALRWLETWAVAHNLSLSQLIEDEHGRQARHRVIVEHLFTSLREVTHLSWENHFEELSLVEQILRRDPARVYAEMDFDSRDQVRHLVERLARRWGKSEIAVAEEALALAQTQALTNGTNPALLTAEQRKAEHVGYYFFYPGRNRLCRSLGKALRPWCEPRDVLTSHPNLTYFSALTALVAFFLYAAVQVLAALRLFSPSHLVLLGIALLVPAGEWATQVLHWVLMRLVPPRRLLKLEFRHGVPPEYRTMVVIPALLSSVAEAEELTHRLEVHRLANLGENIHFALLTDLPDAPAPELPGDAEILETAAKRIAALNARYPATCGSSFYLMHRRRQWNPCEGVWMGWERKRGKLTEFNALLCGDRDTSFTLIEGDTSILPTVRYVITLDADTQLPRDAAVKLIGALAHPLNAPTLAPDRSRVISGHGLLQPRISISHASTQRSWFALLCGGKTGLDVYTCAVSDPYQELFQFGIYTGKGIYDVKVFDQLLRDRIPDNSILSHDLLEGGFLRAGLVTDVELLDDYPPSFLSSLARSHRWARGDLQLLPWLWPRVCNRAGVKVPARLPMVTRWQMIDNWRRIMLSPVLFGLVLLGLVVLPGRQLPLSWPFLVVLGVWVLRWLYNLGAGLRQGLSLPRQLAPSALAALFLPYQALTMLDAVVRTLYRMCISRRHLLEWVTSAHAGRQTPRTLRGTWRRMAGGQLLVLGSAVAVTAAAPPTWPLTWSLAAIWLTAPFWAFLLNKPVRQPKPRLNADQTRYLREISRRTWHFFTTVAGAEDNWLPPDNLQLDPDNGVAHRTSPTNIGLFLASTTAARDFGYLTTTELLDRLERTVSTLEKLPRWHGHFYNWYDTITLEPLEPRYVSTVDSGNLVAYLIAVKEAVRERLNGPLVDSQSVRGLLDTWRWEAARSGDRRRLEPPAALKHFAEHRLRELDAGAPGSLAQWYYTLTLLEGDPVLPVFTASVQAARHELETLFPWLKAVAGLDYRESAQAGSAWQITLPLGQLLERLACLRSLPEVVACAEELPATAGWGTEGPPPDEAGALEVELRRLLGESRAAVLALKERGERLMARLEALAAQHDFRPLFDWKRRLFAIGYNFSTGKLDPSYYDLMASEARQTSFVAIALGQVPTRHWSQLARLLTLVRWVPTLVSWSGTMFEYFLPLLLLPNYPNTLWDQTYRMVIHRQIAYAKERGVPWGISESGFNAHDFQLNYQYQAFGVPGLGLKPGLGADQVIAPYATFLAAMMEPVKAVKNLRLLEGFGGLGEYGFYEALDFTPGRVPEGATCAVVKSYMVHHQGMILLSLANVLLGPRLQQRFMADPRMEATESLLRERTPARALILSQGPPPVVQRVTLRDETTDLRYFVSADSVLPEARVLSNGRYLVMLSNSGGGFSQWGDLAVTRWREDPIRDASGTFLYFRNLTTNALWSPTHHPCRSGPDDCSMRSFLEKVVYERIDGDIHTQMEVCVSPEVDAEVRKVTLTNRGETSCILEATSYLEPVLSPPADDEAHPAFNRLFVETEVVPDAQAVLAHRRPRRPEGLHPWVAHAIIVEGQTLGPLEYETDRSRFVGRGRFARLPQAIATNQRLSGTTGTVLDPILCLRRRLEIPPGQAARVWLVTGAAESREEVLRIVRQFQQPFQLARAFELAWIRSRIELRYLDLTPRQANLFQWMASQLFYFNHYRRERAEACLQNTKGQSGLWAYGISGDLPIVLVRVSSLEGLHLVATVLRAHEYWRLKGLRVDLVILNDSEASYKQPLQEELRRLLEKSADRDLLDRPGGVFLRSALLMPKSDQVLLETVARLSLRAEGGDLVSQLQLQADVLALTAFAPDLELPLPARPLPPFTNRIESVPTELSANLLFFNGWGGFTPSGRAYVLHLEDSELPPVPWINILANPHFGCLVSEAGSGYTWSENSREHKLTPWSNDPVLDPPGEICYLRDEDDGSVWSLTALPLREPEPYEVRHGQGYTVFVHHSHGLDQTGVLFVPRRDPLKILRLTLRNDEDRPRRLSVAYYAEWVLGVSRDRTAPYLVTEWDPTSRALLARNVYQDWFRGREAFLHVTSDDPAASLSYTGDRAEFIGRNRSYCDPAGLERPTLSGHTGALYDPCGAVQLTLTLEPHAERTVIVLLGAARSTAEVQQLVQEYSRAEKVEEAFQDIRSAWDDLLGRVQVSTPDPALDLLVNRWLIYQTLSCRMWARSAFYQSGGAYGFRDQLQDSLALLHARPDLTRQQILRHAAHQFREGDVQHWWHEEIGCGIRTRCSDDYLWLPYAAVRYTTHTGDETLWEEMVPFLEAEPLAEGEDERYGPACVSSEKGSVYEHCVRAIDRSLRLLGPHGLPLIGTGDWNDALNRVGREGRGESVWLGWFLYTVLRAFAPVCAARGDTARATRYDRAATLLVEALEQYAWDGQWYRRAYNDLGTPLGSLQNNECQIDCIAQAWAVISEAASPQRALTAMESLHHRLVERDEGLVLLLTPPFGDTDPSPGYIQAYPKGVRENGGQYTHAAIWAVIAWAKLGEGNRAYELLRLLNPVYHARTTNEALRYRVEPYVMAADVYSVPPHVGRGGWTWYTGAAGWMYQAVLEWVLGIQRQGSRLHLRPCIPEQWRNFSVSYRYGNTRYEILVENPRGRQTGAAALQLDGASLDPADPSIPLEDDGQTHRVVLTL
ncbi:MAG: glucoamylase family protein [Bacillota bacterium]|nr:glucoamylase family protein [Bacillota bacterium]